MTGFDPLGDQEQQIVPSIDVDFGPQGEIRFRRGAPGTQATDRILNTIVGRRFGKVPKPWD